MFGGLGPWQPRTSLPAGSMGSAESGIILASLLLSHCCSVLAIIERKGIFVEDEPRRNYRLEDFLWSGSGDGDGSGDNEATWATTTIFRTTTILTTIYPTPVFPEPCPGQECHISPTPTVFPPGPTVTLQPTLQPPYLDLPDQKYWLVTVLEANGTAVDLSPSIFEQRLARLYRTAFHRQQEKHLKLNSSREKKTVSRERRETVSVRVHRVRRNPKDNSLELVYTVRVAGKAVDANVAAEDMRLVADHEVTSLLGFPVLTKAEPFLKTAETLNSSERDLWLVVGGSVTAVLLILALIILVVLLLIGKKKRKSSGSRSRSSMLQKEMATGTDNLGFQDEVDATKGEESNGDEEEERRTKRPLPTPRDQGVVTPKPRPRSYKPSTPNSYLSMPSVKAFPRGAAKPGPLEEVLETTATRSAALSRHSSESADPGVVGPLVWDLHCHRLSKKESEESPNPDLSVGRMRRRFHELLDDAFSLFGSGSASPDEAESASAYNYGRAKSAVVLPVDPLSAEKVLRPKTTEAVRPATAGVGRVPRGAWGMTPPSSPPGSAPLRPFSAGPFHTPTLEPAWILSDSSLKPSDPAVPLIKAIKSELDKFPHTGSYRT